ncbi:MAG: hypothetical protein ACWA5T_00750 [Parvularcula sp.]
MEVGLDISERTDALERIWRNPRWLAVGAGATGGAMAGGASLGGVALLAGIGLSPVAIAALSGFFLSTQLAGLGLSRGKSFATGPMIASALSVGHTFLLVAFGLAALMPDLALALLVPTVGAGVFSLFPGSEGSVLLTFGPLFLGTMAGYSVLAPVSLIIFRYIAFRK